MLTSISDRLSAEFDTLNFEDSPLGAEVAQNAATSEKLRVTSFPRPKTTRIISVTNQKGGVGKTTTVVNLAAALAKEEMRVLVLDLDPQGNASTALGIPHGDARKPSSADVLIEGVKIADCVKKNPELPTLDVVCSTIDLAAAELKLVVAEDKEFIVKNALLEFLTASEARGDRYDYVFIDCPPSMGVLVVNALTAATEVLVAIQSEYYALEGLALLNDTVTLVRDNYNPQLAINSVIVTMYDSRTNLSQEVYENVKQYFPAQLLNTVIPRNVQIAEAPSHHETVITYDPRSTGALAYREAALELAKRTPTGGII
jgi:chromosome partitioning protein